MDSTLRPFAEGLDLTGTPRSGDVSDRVWDGAKERYWELDQVLSGVAQYHLGRRDRFAGGFED
jgi:hypothetical protein